MHTPTPVKHKSINLKPFTPKKKCSWFTDLHPKTKSNWVKVQLGVHDHTQNPFSPKLSSSTAIPLSKPETRNLMKLKRYRVRYPTDQQKETVELRLSATWFDLVTKRIIWKWIRNSVSPNSETREVAEVAESRLLILLRFQNQNALSFHWGCVLYCVALPFLSPIHLCSVPFGQHGQNKSYVFL